MRIRLLILCCALALGGCATSAGLADNATSTNLELEQAQNQAVLLNIVRASLRRPPVYLDLHEVAGRGRPTGGATLNLPVGPGPTGPSALGLSLSGQDGPLLTANPLATQEFYQGIMTPLEFSVIDFYIQQGYSKELLFNLFFNRIDLSYGSKVLHVTNYASTDDQLNRFQLLVSRLFRMGLTTELVGKKQTARFCFDEAQGDGRHIGVGRCGSAKRLGLPLSAVKDILGDGTPVFCSTPAKCNNAMLAISLAPRSTDGVVYYLGELARRHLFPDHAQARVVGYHTRIPTKEELPASEPVCVFDVNGVSKDPTCAPVFWVARNEHTSKDMVAVDYDGSTYSVPGKTPESSPVGARSSQVFGIVLQLIALHHSAKDSPRSSTISVVTP